MPPIGANNQLMSTVWGGVDESEGQFRGGATENDRGGGDRVDITSSPLNQFQTYLPATPVKRKDRNLFRMCPGRLLGVSRSVFREGGFGPRSLHLVFISQKRLNSV